MPENNFAGSKTAWVAVQLEQKVLLLGNVIEQGTIKLSSKKVEDVLNYGALQTRKKVQSFLGLAGTFRKIIQPSP